MKYFGLKKSVNG